VTQRTTSKRRKILVVCLGNHCRSPLAAAILARRGKATVIVRSAGLHPRRHVDRPPHPLMITAARELGYDITGHRGVALTPQLLAWADLILAMDQAVLEELQRRADADGRPKIRLYLTGTDVPDPWGKELTAFTDCATLIEQGAAQHLA
jgi:protein-tyrosine phosphatase